MNDLNKMNKRKNYIKTFLFTLVLFCFVQEFQAQENSGYRIVRSNLGSSGSSQSVLTSNGTYKISQSIGQSSVIGTYSNSGYVLRQGYQQPSTNINFITEFNYNLNAKVHPNPFKHSVIITFSSVMRKDISVLMYDVNTKVIHAQEFLPAQQVELRIKDISSGTYFLKVLSGKKHFNTKLIKI
ncbi:T9SS type A sorting domain-containing protein [Winogradskyella sp.]|uniref:T9SS type A sorting domain-containing protein n=1 Tax=Winogradskyella sp. TaxID=1883156 RepID=UPI0025D65B44|nr:T9SS type A sorting domain-containing protein [Winogradskyella sp.]